MEVDEDWQTGRKYMRMDYAEEDEAELDEGIINEIEKVKKELVAQ